MDLNLIFARLKKCVVHSFCRKTTQEWILSPPFPETIRSPDWPPPFPRLPARMPSPFPATPAYDLPPRIRLVTRPDTGRGVLRFTDSMGSFCPPFLVPRPTAQNLPIALGSAPSCPTRG